MIADDLVYLRPSTVEEALAHFASGTHPRYLAGATEILTLAKKAGYPVHTLIDVKRLADTRVAEVRGSTVVLGSSLTLNEVDESGLFPLLGAAAGRIADHTIRNRITLGGNVCGALPYREAVLPLLLADATLISAVPPAAVRRGPLRDRFSKRLALEAGELVLGFEVSLASTTAPWFHDRRTRAGPVDYPLVTVCALGPRTPTLAVTGAHPYPVWVEAASAEAALKAFGPARADQRATAEYREHLLGALVRRAWEVLA